MGDRRNHFTARAHHDRAATQFALQLVRRAPHRWDRIPFYHRLVAAHRRSWFFFVSNFRHHSCDAPLNMPRLPYRRLDGAALLRHGAFDWRYRLHCIFEWRHDLAGPQDGISHRLDSEVSANRDSHRHTRVVHRDRADPDEAERVRHGLHSSGEQQGLHLRLRLSRRSRRFRKRFKRPVRSVSDSLARKQAATPTSILFSTKPQPITDRPAVIW